MSATTEPADSARAAHLPKEGATNAKPTGSLTKLTALALRDSVSVDGNQQ